MAGVEVGRGLGRDQLLEEVAAVVHLAAGAVPDREGARPEGNNLVEVAVSVGVALGRDDLQAAERLVSQ